MPRPTMLEAMSEIQDALGRLANSGITDILHVTGATLWNRYDQWEISLLRANMETLGQIAELVETENHAAYDTITHSRLYVFSDLPHVCISASWSRNLNEWLDESRRAVAG